jgi:hypothetical protein
MAPALKQIWRAHNRALSGDEEAPRFQRGGLLPRGALQPKGVSLAAAEVTPRLLLFEFFSPGVANASGS